MERLAPLGLRSLTAAPPSLEELFLRHYEGSGSVEGADDGAAAGSAGAVGSAGPAGPAASAGTRNEEAAS